jgi:hypothetical protein
MQNFSAVLLIIILTASILGAKTPAPLRVKPVCGNMENGIVVGKPRLFDERTVALMVDTLETRLAKLRASRVRAYRSSDTLTEETQLTYQILNLRSIAERALSDRVALAPARTGSVAVARAQTLVAFQISVDPRTRYRNATAEVEIAISTRDSHQPPTLISLLPKDKTYDVATLAHGEAGMGSAVLEMAPIGDGKESLYIARDSDTVALERLSPSREAIKGCATGFHESVRDVTFAWQFRPVFGRDRVDPGTREVYALLALPTSPGEDYNADIHVHTHWRSLKPVKVKNGLEYLEESARDELWQDAIRFNPAEMEQSLRPRISEARFVPAGKGELTVIAVGQNFFPDTSVMVGDKTFSGPALQIERERQLKFTAPAKLLVENDIYIAGRFGAPILLVEPRALSEDRTVNPAWGLKIEYARARPKESGQCELRIKVKSRLRKKPMDDWMVNTTLASVAGEVAAVTSLETEPTDSDAVLIRMELPAASLRAAPRLTLARLFGGDLYRDSADVVLEDDITASGVTLLSMTDSEITLAVAGSGFSNLAEIQVAGLNLTRWTAPALELQGPSMIIIKLNREQLAGARQLTVRQGFAKPVVLPLPPIPAEPSRGKPRKRQP